MRNNRVNVGQREYAIALQSTNKTLVTNNILTCTALFGFDKINGISFLVHFDSPKSTESLPSIVKKLHELSGNISFDEVVIANGTRLASPFWTNKVRNSILKQLKEHSCFAQAKVTDLGYVKKGLKRQIVLNATNFKYQTIEYLCGVSSRRSKKMSKANGSD